MSEFKLKLERAYKKEGYTIGNLYVNGGFFCNTLEDTDRGLTSKMSPLEIAGRKIPGQTAIPTGKYDITLNVVSPKFGKRPAYAFCGGKLPRLLNVPGFEGVLIHCLHPDMEILTDKGWLNLEGFRRENPQKCWSLNTTTGKIELVPIDKLIVEKCVGELYCCEYPQGIYNSASYRVTSEHKMLCEVPLAYGTELRFVNAKDIPLGSSFIAAGNTSIEKGVDDHTLVMCKLCMHIVADGYVKWYNTNGEERATVTFHYKKQRKIERIISLLDEAGLEYSVHTNRDGSTSIRILHPDSDMIAEMVDPEHLGKDGKGIPVSFTMLPKDQMRQLIEEYHFADGRFTHMKNGDYQYEICSTNLDTLEKIQTMAFLSGWSTSMYHARYGCDKWKDAYVLNIKKDVPKRTPVESCYTKKPYSGDVYCIQNKNHTIVVKNSTYDVPFIIGNCGNYPKDTEGCLLVGKNSVKGAVMNSTAIFKALYAELDKANKRGDKITIEIS